MLTRLASIAASFRSFSRHSNIEHEQSLVRFAMASFICLVVVWHVDLAHPPHVILMLIGFFMSLTTLIMVDIFRRPEPVPVRRVIAFLSDAGGISCGMMFADELGIPIYLFYLWITFGNGFRFGNQYLYGTLLASLAGLSLVLWQVDYWQHHRALGIGLWSGLALLGLYFSALVSRLTAALQREEAANQAKRSFISSVSHEMRTPLNAIIGMTDLLKGTRLDREQEAMMGSLDTAAELMLALVEDVLDFSKIEAGKLTIEDTAFNPHLLAAGLIDLFQYQAAASGLHLRLVIDPALPNGLLGDPHHLRQVLVNLMSNAIKFTEQGYVVLRITLVPDIIGEMRVRFDIEDTGIGIDPAAQVIIFDGFTQAEASTTRRYGGTGLGTTISRQLVELMGGKLGLRSRVGVGSTFWFDLALRPHTVADTAGAVKHRRQHSAAIYSLLVADDNATNRTVLRMMLERAGHQCTLAEDGNQVLDELEERTFDAVILDMNMPHMNGSEAARAIRFTTLPGLHLPLIMLSADVSAETQEECRLAGIDQFLPKPIRIDDLLDALDRLIVSPGALLPRASEVSLHIVAPPMVRNAVFDVEKLAEIEAIGRDERFFDGLVTGFIEDTQVVMEKIAVAIGNQQFGSLRDLLHVLKGSSMCFGAQALSNTCAQIEKSSNADLCSNGQLLHAQLREVVGQLLDALEQYRRTRSKSHT
jgi:two-component system sensor histidine kinase RpfC